MNDSNLVTNPDCTLPGRVCMEKAYLHFKTVRTCYAIRDTKNRKSVAVADGKMKGVLPPSRQA